MKVAVAFFGLPRCSKITVPSIESRILSLIPAYATVKCFYHFYLQNNVVNAHSNENGELDQSNYNFFSSFEGLLEKPEDVYHELNFEQFKKFGNAWGSNDFNSLRNLLLQLRSLKKVTELVEVFDPDVVLFIRPDLFYHDSISEFYLKYALKYPQSIFVPKWQWGVGVNDRFAVAGKKSYKSYGRRAEDAMAFCDSGNKPLHSERLLKYVLLKNKVEILILNVKASRVRINQEFVNEKFSTRISIFSPITNKYKRFLFWTIVKTKLKILSLFRKI